MRPSSAAVRKIRRLIILGVLDVGGHVDDIHNDDDVVFSLLDLLEVVDILADSHVGH